MLKKRVPKRLWDYDIKWVCEVMQRTASTSGDSPDELLSSNLQAKHPKFLSILILPFMTGAGTMTMPG